MTAPTQRLAALRIVRWIDAREKPFTAAVLARATGVTTGTANRWLRTLESAGVCVVGQLETERAGQPARVWERGA